MHTPSRKKFELFAPSGTIGRGDSTLLAAAKEREDERWRRARSIGIVGTVLLHLLVLLVVRQSRLPPPSPLAAAGPAAGDIRPAAGGGSGLTMLEVRPERPPPVEEIPEPLPEPEPEEIEITPIEVELPSLLPEPELADVPSLPGLEAPGTGGQEDGPDTGPGIADGTGDGGGGTSDGGASQVIPPTPRGVFIPPQGRPGSARGQEITVWVYVTEAGRVERTSIRLEPPTSDSRYNERLMQSVAEWIFDPARREGQTVSFWYPFQIIL